MIRMPNLDDSYFPLLELPKSARLLLWFRLGLAALALLCLAEAYYLEMTGLVGALFFSALALFITMNWRKRPVGVAVGNDGVILIDATKERKIPAEQIVQVHSDEFPHKRHGLVYTGIDNNVLFGLNGFRYTSNRGGYFGFYTQEKNLVWLELRIDNPVLISPRNPDEFIAACQTLLKKEE